MIVSDDLRDQILAKLTAAREVLPVIASVGEAFFPAETLEIAGTELLLDKVFELVIKLSAKQESIDALKARMRADTLAEVRAVPQPPVKAP